MDIQVLEEIKNKRGELKTRIVRVTNKTPKKGLDFESINTLYKTMLEKYKPENIFILGKPMDGGFSTIKSIKYMGSELKFANEDYYSSLPQEVQAKVQGRFYSIDITVSL